MVLEKSDGLSDNFCVDLIPEISNARNSRILHQHVAQIFRDTLPEEQCQYRNGEQCPDAMNLGGEEGVQVDFLMSEGVCNQGEPVIPSFWIEYCTNNRGEHQRDQTFREAHYGKAHDPGRKPHFVRHYVTQQPAEFFPFIQKFIDPLLDKTMRWA